MTRGQKRIISLAIGSLFFFIACGVKHRIKENQDYFNSLKPEAQEVIKEGEIDIGFTPQMVYLAWGNPSEKGTQVQLKTESETWIYTYYRTNYDTAPLWYTHSHYWRYNTGLGYIEREYLVLDRYVIFENGKVIEYGEPHYTFYGPVTTIYPSYCGFFSIHSRYGCGSFNRIFIPHLQKLNN